MKGELAPRRLPLYSFEATLLKLDVTLVPIICMALIAAIEIIDATRAYSIAVAPFSFFDNLIKMASIFVPSFPNRSYRDHAVVRFVKMLTYRAISA